MSPIAQGEESGVQLTNPEEIVYVDTGQETVDHWRDDSTVNTGL